jgi:sec-independent protein translocase protein TatB
VFDIGFFELLVVAIVALVVIGPERLPETVRSISLWIGRLKRSLRETRSELEKQLGADDIRRQLHNEDVMQSLEKTRRDIESAVQTTRDTPAYTPHKELPDHAHMDEVPTNVAETNATTATNELSEKTQQP